MHLRTIAKGSLVALAVPATLLSIAYLFVGLSFGFDLWRLDRPFAIMLWFAIVLFPVFIGVTIRGTTTLRQLWIMTTLAWSFAAFWVFVNFVWMPWTYGGPWGW